MNNILVSVTDFHTKNINRFVFHEGLEKNKLERTKPMKQIFDLTHANFNLTHAIFILTHAIFFLDLRTHVPTQFSRLFTIFLSEHQCVIGTFSEIH